MRKSMMIAAAVAATAANVPAQATMFTVLISGDVTGTRTTGTLCANGLPGCSVDTPFTTYVNTYPFVVSMDFVEGANSFQTGSPFAASSGLLSGTIINSGGVLSGVNLRYGYQSCSTAIPLGVGCYVQFGTASVFNVTNVTGVPEATTWAMMVAGFGLIGFGLRRSPKTVMNVTYAA